MLLAQMSYSLDVVGMVMSDQYSLYLFKVEHTFLKYFLNGADTDTGINQYSGAVSSQVVTVSAAAAGQTHKSYCHFLSFFAKGTQR